jgi:hypothetical protein
MANVSLASDDASPGPSEQLRSEEAVMALSMLSSGGASHGQAPREDVVADQGHRPEYGNVVPDMRTMGCQQPGVDQHAYYAERWIGMASRDAESSCRDRVA